MLLNSRPSTTVRSEFVSASNKVFISYRRDDASGHAGRIYDRLCNDLGRERVFMDVDGIPYGADYAVYLREQLSQCGYVLALIGKHWLHATDEHGKRRLDNARDFVRIELTTALMRDVVLVPILLDGASMPRSDELPDGLESLSLRNALTLSVAGFHSEIARLVGDIKTELARREQAEAAEQRAAERQARDAALARERDAAERRERKAALKREQDAPERADREAADRRERLAEVLTQPAREPASSDLAATFPRATIAPYAEAGKPAFELERSAHLDDAGSGSRVLNFAIDAGILECTLWLVSNLLRTLLGELGEAFRLLLVSPIVFFVYYASSEIFFQRTPAKWITRTRVVALDGSPPTTTQILLRTLVRFVPIEPLTFLGSGTGLHDRWSRTRVVRDW